MVETTTLFVITVRWLFLGRLQFPPATSQAQQQHRWYSSNINGQGAAGGAWVCLTL